MTPTLFCSDPKASYSAHRKEIDAAVRRVLRSGKYILAGEVEAFEGEFARYLKVKEVVAVASGTQALQLALETSGIVPGDRVAIPSLSASATAAAVQLAGGVPVFIDSETSGYLISPALIKEAARRARGKERLKAVIPVHLYGFPAKMDEIMALARKYSFRVIEDCAQSHGASYLGRKTGVWGDLAAFSFYPTKNLGALGDGGAIATQNPLLARKLRLLREYGWKKKFVSSILGMNSRLDEVQAAILRVKLKYLDQENAKRREVADLYKENLRSTNLVLPRGEGSAVPVYHQYVVSTKRRDSLKRFLHKNFVEAAVHYPTPLHRQPAYRRRSVIGPGGLLQTEKKCRQILSLPMYPELLPAKALRVASLIRRWGN